VMWWDDGHWFWGVAMMIVFWGLVAALFSIASPRIAAFLARSPRSKVPRRECPRVAALLARYLYSPHVFDCGSPAKQTACTS